MKCPQCGFDNIEGVDDCEECQQPLGSLSHPQPNCHVERSLLRDRLQVLGPKTPKVVAPDDKVGDVLNLLVERSIGCVLVMDGEKLVGIFSERDALMRLNTEAGAQREKPISQFMTPDPKTLCIDDKIAFALHMMDLGGYRHIPIRDESDKIVGVISIRDILRYITEDLVAAGA